MAWWNDDWSSRRQITVDAAATGGDIDETLSDFPMLVRLHSGNFAYFVELADNGQDLRFLGDDQMPLPQQVEQVDVLNEIGLVWVKPPQIRGGAGTNAFWMYYGNADAPDASDGKNLYDAAQGLVYHFKSGETVPQDATAYVSHALESKAQIDPAGWIGAAAKFTGAGGIRIAPAPQLAISTEKGWTFSAWLKIDQAQNAATVLSARDGANFLQLSLQGGSLVAGSQGGNLPPMPLTLGRWHHVALVVQPENLAAYAGNAVAQNPRSYAPPQILELYIDGLSVGSTGLAAVPANPSITLGDDWLGWLDEVQIAATARSADWIKFSYRSQSPDFSVLGFGEDESNASGDSHFKVIVQNVTVDGWVVIGLTGFMFAVAVWVMIAKTLVILRTGKDNFSFLEQYRKLDPGKLGALDQPQSQEEAELADSDLLTALVGKHDHFQSSPLYRLYHLGLQELQRLHWNGERPLPPEAWNFLRVKFDSHIVGESQRLNRHMVLLTIAIAGGPFLGLLGTVVGVMITFAAIAATGDVNINSIAPGIAAALLATVAGLAVAIPSLFAYNYLLTQIKDITAAMRIFTDEFLAVLSMNVAKHWQEKQP